MVKYLGLFLVVTGLIGCGTHSAIPTDVSPEVTPYVTSFYEDVAYELPNKQVYEVDSVKIVEQFPNWTSKAILRDKHVMGICLIINNISREVYIRSGYWSIMTEGSRWEIVYHELVHCALGKEGHDSQGLMAPATVVTSTMDTFYTLWMDHVRRNK